MLAPRPIHPSSRSATPPSVFSFTSPTSSTASTDTVNGNWNYSYDQFNRLVCANLATNGACSSPTSGTPTYSYVYDRFGNRWQQNGPHSMIESFTGNNSANNNRMDGYSYDSAGNLLNDGTNFYTYDAENRIVEVQLGSSTGTVIATYLYDANGQRVHRTGVITDTCDGTGKRDYVYDLAGHWTLEVNSNGTSCKNEIYAGSRHFVTNGGDTFFDHSDWLGTVRLRNTYRAPNQFETCTSLPFGDAQTCVGGDQSTIHFTGKERDSESGLDNFGARYDSSSMGRFMSPDPIYIEEQKMLDPQELNLYSYVRNNPLNLTDSTGMLVDVNCQQVTAAQCSQTVTDFNNRDGAQFQVTRDDKTGQLNVDGNVDPTKLSGGELALYNSITNTDATGTVTVVGNDPSFDFEKSTGKGQNSVDRSDLNALNGADKRLSGEVISHAALESYDSAKPGVSVDQAHDFAQSFFGFKYGRFTPNFASQVNTLFLNFRSTRLNEDFRATLTLKTPIPMVTFRKMQAEGGVLSLPRDVTKATLLP